MAVDSEADRSRAVVKTYVPAYQKDEWARHADALGMSHSEYVRTMVQAGRRGFTGNLDSPTTVEPEREPVEPDTEPPTSTNLEERILERLSTDEYRSWDELSESFEKRLESTLDSLEKSGRILHSHRKGGYILAEADER